MATTTLKRFIGEGLKESGPNRNVLNVLRVLIEDEGTIVYLPANYERGNRKRIDESVHQGLRHAPVAMPVDEFVPNMERFNFSVRGLKEVLVENESGELEPKKVFRSYNVIRDGKLHIDKLEAKLSQESYIELVAAGILYDQVGRKVNGEKSVYNAGYIYTVDFSELPLVSTHWAQPSNIGFVDFIEEEAYLTELVKSMKKVEKEWREQLISEGTLKVQESDIYHESTQYAGEITDYIDVECVAYRIQSDDLKADIKEAKDLSRIHDKYNRNYTQLAEDLRYYKHKLQYDRFIIRAVAFAIENTKKQGSFDWSEKAKLPRSKNKMVQRATVGEGKILEKITWADRIPV